MRGRVGGRRRKENNESAERRVYRYGLFQVCKLSSAPLLICTISTDEKSPPTTMWNRPIGGSGAAVDGPKCDLLKFFGLSSLIYSINVAILLIIALSTDYWEYRGFDFVSLYKVISKSNRSKVIIPRDTNTYLQFLYYYPRPFPDTIELSSVPLRNETFYQSPILVRKYYINYTGIAPPQPEENPVGRGKYGRSRRRKTWRRKNTTASKRGTDALTKGFDPSMLGPHLDVCEIVIFLQYGNLFRDCEDLESKYN